MSKIVVVHGTPGSGKTTHAHRLKEHWSQGLEHISIGNQLRSIRMGEVDSHFKKDIDHQADVLAQSAPLNHEVVNGVIFEFIENCPSAGYVLIDGYPRFLDQLPLFYNSLTLGGHGYIGLIHLQISLETCISRLTKSRGTRSGEKDVDEDFATWRFNEYQDHTIPTIALLGRNVPIISIDAEPPMDKVWEMFFREMQSLTFNQ